MAKKTVSHSSKPAKTGRKDIETSFSTDSKIKKLKHTEMLSGLAPHIKLQMEELFRHEEKILMHLKDPRKMELFVKDPLKFFTISKIELSPVLKMGIGSFNLEESFESKKFILPNGQVMKPKIKINIKEK